MLLGLLRCALCGEPVSSKAPGKLDPNGEPYRYYNCRKFSRRRLAPPARIELATLALGKPCSIQLSYGGGRRRLSRPHAMLKLCRGLLGIFGFGSRRGRRAGALRAASAPAAGSPERARAARDHFEFDSRHKPLGAVRLSVGVRQPSSRVTNHLTKFESQRKSPQQLRRKSPSKMRSVRRDSVKIPQAKRGRRMNQRSRRNVRKRIAPQRTSVMVIASLGAYSRVQELVLSRLIVGGLLRSLRSAPVRHSRLGTSSGALSGRRPQGGTQLNTKMTTRYLDPVPQPRRPLCALVTLAVLGLALPLAGCSVLVDASRAQCSQNSDCTSHGLEHSTCEAGLCKEKQKCSQDADCTTASEICSANYCEVNTCTQDSDCTSRGAAFAGTVCAAGACQADPQWSCSSGPVNPAVGYKLSMHLQDAVSMEALPGVVAQLCRKLDVNCDKPVGSSVTADAMGNVHMSIEAGFDGYVQLTDPKIAPALYFLTAPASGDLDLPIVPLASPFAATGIVLSSSAGTTSWLSDRGLVLLNAFDCQGATAANISFSVGGTHDPSSFIFYLVGTLPSANATATDSTGYGGLVNVPVGVSTITATLAPSGVQVSKLSVLVRAGYISYSKVTPNSL